jgi:type 1 fimbria pilin
MKLTIIIAISAILALSGCINAAADSNLKYNGAANGAHSDTVKCTDTGKIKGSGNVPDGQVSITLKDSAGKQLFQETFKGTFTLSEKTVSGASGSWGFEAQRSSESLVAGDKFRGDYSFHVTC